MVAEYEVYVQGKGTVHLGTVAKAAKEAYAKYVKQVDHDENDLYGRKVSLFKDGYVNKEYQPEQEEKMHYYSGVCNECESEWDGMEDQYSSCPVCGCNDVEAMEDEDYDEPGEGITVNTRENA